MAETSTIFGFMKYVSATDILSDFKKTVDSHFVNSLKQATSKLPVFVYRICPLPWTMYLYVVNSSSPMGPRA